MVALPELTEEPLFTDEPETTELPEIAELPLVATLPLVEGDRQTLPQSPRPGARRAAGEGVRARVRDIRGIRAGDRGDQWHSSIGELEKREV